MAHGDGSPTVVNSVLAKLTKPMTTRLIFRTNFKDGGDPGFMPDHVLEMSHYSVTPAAAA